MEYEDPIISHFKGKEEITKEKLSELINAQKLQRSPQKTSVASNRKQLANSNLRHCEKALSIFTDVLKLKFLIEKSWDLQALNKSVLVRFDIQTGALPQPESKQSHAETFYKDLAMKTISRCGKMSKAIEQLSGELQVISEYIRLESNVDTSFCIEDTACLLLEMWFLCGRVVRGLKRNVAALFMRAKLLLIDCELEAMRATAKSGYEDLGETVVSYRSFIKVLLQQLQDAESIDDQELFEECLQVFIDVESMYNAMNLNWLILETDMSELSSKSRSGIMDEVSELQDITDFVDNAVNGQAIDDADEFSSMPVEELDLAQERRMSDISDTSKISLMMEKTSLKRELPNLLQAFNNAKKLEQELENARAAKNEGYDMSLSGITMRSPPPSLSSSMLSPSSSLRFNTSPRAAGDLSSSFYSSSSSMILENDAKTHDEVPTKSPSVTYPRLSSPDVSLHSINNEFLKLSNFQQTPSMRQRNVQGFGSSVLNSLYGLGNKS